MPYVGHMVSLGLALYLHQTYGWCGCRRTVLTKLARISGSQCPCTCVAQLLGFDPCRQPLPGDTKNIFSFGFVSILYFSLRLIIILIIPWPRPLSFQLFTNIEIYINIRYIFNIGKSFLILGMDRDAHTQGLISLVFILCNLFLKIIAKLNHNSIMYLMLSNIALKPWCQSIQIHISVTTNFSIFLYDRPHKIIIEKP